MNLKDLSIIHFLNEVDSKSPAPGGGSASALASSLGVSLSRMVGHLTISRKMFFELSETSQNEYKYNFNLLNIIKDKLIFLIDEDTVAFNGVIDALKLPKNNDEEIRARQYALELANSYAIEVPLEVAKLSYKALEVIEKLEPYSNPNAISDIGVGVLLLYAGIEGALLNVKISLSQVREEQKSYYLSEIKKIQIESIKLKSDIMEKVNNRIN